MPASPSAGAASPCITAAATSPARPTFRSRLFDFLHGYAYAGKIEVGLAAAGICRRTFELWRHRYPFFARQFEELYDLRQEVIRIALVDAQRAGDPVALRYLLRQQAWLRADPRYPRNSHPVPWRFTTGHFLGTILNAEAARRRDEALAARAATALGTKGSPLSEVSTAPNTKDSPL